MLTLVAATGVTSEDLVLDRGLNLWKDQ